MNIYSDNFHKLKNFIPENKVYPLKDYQNNKFSVFVIFNENIELEEFLDKGFIITFFKSELSDFEINTFDDELIKNKLEYILNFLDKKDFNIINEDIVKKESKEIKDEVVIDKYDVFGGVYVNDVLIKRGNIRFIPLLDVILAVWGQKHNGKLLVKENKLKLYEISFIEGEIVSLKSYTKQDNFQYYLKKYGYISQVDKNMFFYPVKKQLEIYLENNSVLKNEKDLIYKDYIIFIFRNLITLKKGDFELTSDNPDSDFDFFVNDYFSFLYNFTGYIKTVNFNFENLNISVNESALLNIKVKEVVKLLNVLNESKETGLIYKFFKDYDKEYLNKLFYFLKLTKVIEIDKNDNFPIIKNNIKENIEKRIDIWLNKIKVQNYFDILGVEFNDSEDFIKEKYENIISRFFSYLSSDELRKKHKGALEEIIFEIESAYSVLKNAELREKYYKKMLK